MQTMYAELRFLSEGIFNLWRQHINVKNVLRTLSNFEIDKQCNKISYSTQIKLNITLKNFNNDNDKNNDF